MVPTLGVLEAEADLHLDLEVGHLAILHVPADAHHLHPADLTKGLTGAPDAGAHRLGDAVGGGPGDLDNLLGTRFRHGAPDGRGHERPTRWSGRATAARAPTDLQNATNLSPAARFVHSRRLSPTFATNLPPAAKVVAKCMLPRRPVSW